MKHLKMPDLALSVLAQLVFGLNKDLPLSLYTQIIQQVIGGQDLAYSLYLGPLGLSRAEADAV